MWSWTINIGRFGGVPVRLHFSFLLFLTWIALQAGADPLGEVLFACAVFTCVALHELGHAFAAKKFSVETRDIVLYPIGGIATMGTPPTPRAELVIAAAGPLVNIVIAALLWPVASSQIAGVLDGTHQDLVTQLFLVNIVLAVFNLLPAYPMDGGRILRAILAISGSRQALVIAARTSQIISLALGITGLLIPNYILAIIAVFVFLSASREMFESKTLELAKPLLARDVMTDRSLLTCLPSTMTVSVATDYALKSFQAVFPILRDKQLAGSVHMDRLLSASSHEPDTYVTSLADTKFAAAQLDEPLSVILKDPERATADTIFVLENAEFRGAIFKEKLIEYLVLKENIRQAQESTARDEETS